MYVLKFEFEFRDDVHHICMCANPVHPIGNKRDNLIVSELVQGISRCKLKVDLKYYAPYVMQFRYLSEGVGDIEPDKLVGEYIPSMKTYPNCSRLLPIQHHPCSSGISRRLSLSSKVPSSGPSINLQDK